MQTQHQQLTQRFSLDTRGRLILDLLCLGKLSLGQFFTELYTETASPCDTFHDAFTSFAFFSDLLR